MKSFVQIRVNIQMMILTCVYATGCDTCSGETDGTGTVVDNDSDGDGVCDADEIAGCQDATAHVTIMKMLQMMILRVCMQQDVRHVLGEIDGTGTVVDNDIDSDGVCDDDEVFGCTDETACNYDLADDLTTDDDSLCTC